ncbi:MAG: gliding motility-associated C-terminal domain-containing protein [Bacteroidota bacterium]
MRILLTFTLLLLLFGGGVEAQIRYLINTVDDVDDGTCNTEHCSLREAINAANSDGIPSILWFEINGPGIKSIQLDSMLPAITENRLKIDGTTLASNRPMKGRLVIDGNQQVQNAFTIQSTDVEIYGLVVQNFVETAIEVRSPDMDTISRVTVGRRNQGNIFLKNGTVIDAENINRLVFQANYVGTDFDFNEGLGNRNGIVVNNNWASYENAELIIGGEIREREHNYFASTAEVAVDVSYQGFAKIEGNIFGTGENGDEQLGNTLAVRTSNRRGRIDIGGSERTKNIFAYNETAVVVDRNNFVRVSENSFYCNSIGLTVIENAHPVPVIESGVETVLTGRAQADDFVEIYVTDAQTCNSEDCQGMIYLGTVRANSSGSWQFPGFFQFGQQIVALSRNDGRQSMFSDCFRICPSKVAATTSNAGPFCQNDTIRLQTETEIYGFQWVTSFTEEDIEYEWIGPNGYLSNEKAPKDATLAGDYILTAYLFGCPAGPDTTSVSVVNIDASIAPVATQCNEDSIVVLPSVTSNATNLSYAWTGPNNYASALKNPSDIRTSGTYELTVSGQGCTSEVAAVEITNHIPEVFSLGEQTNICAGDSVLLTISNFENYQWTGDYDLVCDTCDTVNFIPTKSGEIQLSAGPTETCFTTATLKIEVLESVDVTESLILCPESTLTLFAQTVGEPGIYQAQFTGANGCDSIQTYIVEQAEKNVVTERRTICEGESVNAFDQVYTTSGTYQGQFTASNGCDSTHILELEVLQRVAASEAHVLCAGESLMVFGEPVSETTKLTRTFTGSNGCDSVHTVSVTVNQTYQREDWIQLCAGETTTIFNGLEVSRSGFYQRDFTASNGCDSVIMLHIDVLEPIETSSFLSLCDDEAAALFGTDSAFPSDYMETFTAQSGCDSVHTVFYDIRQREQVEEAITICGTETYLINGVEMKASGRYVNTFTNTQGCDSTHIVNLTVLEIPHAEAVYDLCEGETVMVFGQAVGQAGIFSETFTTANGCDSIQTVTVFVKENPETNESITICEGDVVNVFGEDISTTSLLSQVFSSATGCDSTHTVQIEVLPKSFTESSIEICQSACIELYGATACANNLYQQTLTSATGCDSIHITQIVQVEATEIVEEYTLCLGDSIAALNTFLKEAGEFRGAFTAANGCDSFHTVVINLTEPVEASVATQPACSGEANGQIRVNIAGGLGPYNLIWNGEDLGAKTEVKNLAAGEYEVIIRDFLDCRTTQIVSIASVEAPVIEREILNVSCNGAEDGAFTLFSDQNLVYNLNGWVKNEFGNYEDLAPDTYEVIVKDEVGCAYLETVTINEPMPIAVEMPEVYTINLGESVVLEPTIVNGQSVNFEWSAANTLSCLDCQEPLANPLKDEQYQLVIYDENGCEAETNVWVRVNVNKGVFIPNVFSPNDDGQNDRLTLLAAQGPVDEVELFEVYDRWGTLLYKANNFQPNNEQYGWNGQHRGQPMGNGVYMFVAVVRFKDGTEQQFQGDVTLAK